MTTVIFTCAIGAARHAAAQEVFLNYDDMSLFEAPLATEVGDVTLLLKGTAAGAWIHKRKSGGSDESFNGGLQAGAQTQLPNRWRVRLSYTGRYATDPQESPDAGFASRVDEEYEDDVMLSVGGTWGTVVSGNFRKSFAARHGARAGRERHLSPSTTYSARLRTGAAAIWFAWVPGS